ncbi:MAG: DUF4065 domain-containing protein [Geminicoccaceae bacterium]
MASLPLTKPTEAPPFPAVQLANTFIERYSDGGQIDHLKLQKLCYYAYGWWLALSGEDAPLTRDKPQVWKLGPVFRPIYGAFASYRGGLIDKKQKVGPFSGEDSIPVSERNESQFVEWIWGRYGHFDGLKLSKMTHEPGTPWYKIAKEHDFVVPKFLEMNDDENRSYFYNMASEEGLI